MGSGSNKSPERENWKYIAFISRYQKEDARIQGEDASITGKKTLKTLATVGVAYKHQISRNQFLSALAAQPNEQK